MRPLYWDAINLNSEIWIELYMCVYIHIVCVDVVLLARKPRIVSLCVLNIQYTVFYRSLYVFYLRWDHMYVYIYTLR